ncbi:hypothetical protein KR054_000506 [Drosophila jambulina]|nr:hypothetical protein KR054_000506 [Drosophila jambulina]
MIRGVFLLWRPQLILVNLIYYAMGIQYEFLLEDERIFSDCADKPLGTQNIYSMFDTSNMNLAMDDEGISVSGNHTLIWDAQPSDRIEMAGSLRYFDRGTWQPTTLNILSKDFCKVMYDHRQIWYNLYTNHIANRPDIAEKCITEKGTTFIIQPYKLDPHIGLGVPLKPGRYAVRMEFSAFDSSNVKRPNSICTEIRGEFFKA